MFGWHMYNWLWEYIWLYDKSIFGSSLPFCLFVVLCMVLLLLWWLSIYWCEQMRGTPVVNREVMVPLLSLWTGFCFWAFLLGQWPMYCLAFGLYFENIIVTPLCFLFGIVVCLGYCTELYLYSRTTLLYYSMWRFF